MDNLCGDFLFTPFSHCLSLLLQLLSQHEGVMHIFLPMTGEEERNRKGSKKRWMGVDVVYTQTIKGCGVVKTLKGKRLWAVGKTLAQQEADYTTKGFLFANLACTNSNKELWRRSGS